MTSVFGVSADPAQLEAAVVAQLREWLPTYLNRRGEQLGEKLAKPKSFGTVSDYSRFPEQALPSIIVESPGQVSGTVEQNGEGLLSATFSISVFTTVQGPDAKATRDLALHYWWPVIGSLMQHKKLADGIWVSEYVDSGFAGADLGQRRTRIATEHVFYVVLEDFLNVGEGPSAPIPEETDEEYPTVESTSVNVEKQD
jgi:hypothetical protein